MKKKAIIISVSVLAVITLGAIYVHYAPLWVSISTALVACAAFAGGAVTLKYWPSKTK